MADYFDYVVVGGGNAGLVVATRLAEDPSTTVCVLEAGIDVTKRPEITIPGLSFGNMGNPEIDWKFMSTPQIGANNRAIILPRGKGLGGSTMLNFMEIARGHSQEYDAFEKLGAEGWNWNSLLPYFRKSETFTVSRQDVETFGTEMNPEFHGAEGPIQKTMPKWISEVQLPFLKTMESLGIPFNPDGSSGDNAGVWNSNHSIDPVTAARSSSASAYYEPGKGKNNLKVITGAYATRVLLEKNESSKVVTAEGVQYIHEGNNLVIYANKEVLLCGGTFQTPQLLELSGIGNSDILKDYNISPVLDLPGVGQNLRIYYIQDHFWCPYTVEMDEKYDSFEVLGNPNKVAEEMKVYQESRTGMLSTAASTIFAFIPARGFVSDFDKLTSLMDSLTPKNAAHKKMIDLQKTWFKENKVPQLEYPPFPGFMPAPGKSAEPGKHYFSLFMALTHSFSRGTVHISSSDPLAPPSIDLSVLDNPVDLEMMVQALKFSRKVINTEPLRSMMKDVEVIPGPEIESDDDIKEWIKGIVQTSFHPVGTAAMLPFQDGGVVDDKLKVYGTSNLRVIDASILPILISTPTQATIYALAEKAADIIKLENKF